MTLASNHLIAVKERRLFGYDKEKIAELTAPLQCACKLLVQELLRLEPELVKKWCHIELVKPVSTRMKEFLNEYKTNKVNGQTRKHAQLLCELMVNAEDDNERRRLVETATDLVYHMINGNSPPNFSFSPLKIMCISCYFMSILCFK